MMYFADTCVLCRLAAALNNSHTRRILANRVPNVMENPTLDFESLVFFNSGGPAGASQPHRHLQIVPAPLAPGFLRAPIDAAKSAAPPAEEEEEGAPPFGAAGEEESATPSPVIGVPSSSVRSASSSTVSSITTVPRSSVWSRLTAVQGVAGFRPRRTRLRLHRQLMRQRGCALPVFRPIRAPCSIFLNMPSARQSWTPPST